MKKILLTFVLFTLSLLMLKAEVHVFNWKSVTEQHIIEVHSGDEVIVTNDLNDSYSFELHDNMSQQFIRDIETVELLEEITTFYVEDSSMNYKLINNERPNYRFEVLINVIEEEDTEDTFNEEIKDSEDEKDIIKDDIVSVTNTTDDISLIMYPNPCTDFITLDYNITSIRVYNLNGLSLVTEDFGSVIKNFTIDISDFSDGTYIVLVNNAKSVKFNKITR